MKKIIIVAIVIIIIIIGVLFFIKSPSETIDLSNKDNEITENNQEDKTAEENITEENPKETVIGKSVLGKNITAYHYGSGDKELLFIGGIHGGYSWNTVLVARELINFLENNSEIIPENIKVTVIPVLNPDGLNKVVGTDGDFDENEIPSSEKDTIVGRFNENEVDLNRNFDCDWQTTSKWQNRTVSGGDAEFSEPESQAIKNYVEKNNPTAIVTWYSAAGGVFASECHNGVLPETKEITNVYAKASGYKAYQEFNFYEINGDMVNWFAKKGIPAISVLLTTHQSVEWSKNKAGIEALLEYYSK